jgi:hypothetical protein
LQRPLEADSFALIIKTIPSTSFNVIVENNIFATYSSGPPTYYCLISGLPSPVGALTVDYNLYYKEVGSYAYWNHSVSYYTFWEYQNASGWDANSFVAAPQFVDVVSHDYHLKSVIGRWDPVSETWLQDNVQSPAIDAGDSGSDWSAEPLPGGCRVNIGAYGNTEEASLSDRHFPADLNYDCYIDIEDVAIFSENWLGCNDPANSDCEP